MKVCPNCQNKYPDDANFCPQETCATPQGPRRLSPVPAEPAPRFQLTSRLGGGRSGEVWLARDTQTNDDVAYKLVTPQVLPTPAALERAQRELKQLQRAQNPHLARIVDFGRSTDGRLFVATELVNGQNLGDLVGSSGPLAVDRAKKLVGQIGEALLEGQKVGVVHHDLAAKNVLIGSNDEVKLINFVTPWPVSDTVFGVPEYLSPEQAEGKLVDQRSNTYSLGALLYLMLTGQPPVAGADEGAVLQQVLQGALTPPSQLRQGLTPEIDRVVLKAMDKNSSRRPLTMRQFLAEIAGMVGMPGAAVAVAPGAPKGATFAKTMMFAGGAPEVQNLVNQAQAARDAAANGSAPPAVAPVAPAPTPAVPPAAAAAAAAAEQARRTHGAAIAATMIALPSAAPGPIPGAAPAPAADPKPAAPAMQMAAAPPAPAGGGGGAGGGGAGGGAGGGGGGQGGGFRETLWFKKGDVEQMVAEAKAKAAAAAAAKGKPAPAADELPAEDAKPLEDRYQDDGSLTVEDRKKFSLRSGGTATALPAVGEVPGERMSDNEMINEIGGGKKIAIIAVAVVVLIAIVAFVAVSMKGKKKGEGASAEPAAAKVETAAAPAAAPPPAPAAAAPAAAAPAAEAPKAAAEAPKAEAAAPKAEAPAKAQGDKGAPHKHASKSSSSSSKKKSSSKKHH
jgi:hypothetical protein